MNPAIIETNRKRRKSFNTVRKQHVTSLRRVIREGDESERAEAVKTLWDEYQMKVVRQ